EVAQSVDEQPKVGLVETGLLREGGRYITLGPVKGVRDDVLLAHRALLRHVLLLGYGTACDGNLEWRHGMERSAESELHRATYLAVGRAFHDAVFLARGEDGPEGTDVEELTANPVLDPLGMTLPLVDVSLGGCGPIRGRFQLAVDHGSLLDQDVEALAVS